jgi:hypothetical protein
LLISCEIFLKRETVPPFSSFMFIQLVILHFVKLRMTALLPQLPYTLKNLIRMIFNCSQL